MLEMPRGRWHVTQMFLERRLKGACVAAHAAYHDEAYFRELTGLPDVKWIHDKRTETTVTLMLSNLFWTCAMQCAHVWRTSMPRWSMSCD